MDEGRRQTHYALYHRLDKRVTSGCACNITSMAVSNDVLLVIRVRSRHGYDVTTKPKGTGLGLAIVKKIIDEHGGKVHIENRAPTGAQVSIALPPIAAAA